MKRFWKDATFAADGAGFSILLDGRPVRTPHRNPLSVPSEKLARAIVAEWDAVEEKIDPRVMPMTGIANAAIDMVRPDLPAFAAGLGGYGVNEMCCYRSEGPRELLAREEAAWDPLLDWAESRFGVAFVRTDGVMPVDQPDATLDALAGHLLTLDEFQLAGLSPLVSAGGSLVVALAVAEGRIDAAEGWKAARIDEDWHEAQWGEDADAKAFADARKADFVAGSRFLAQL